MNRYAAALLRFCIIITVFIVVMVATFTLSNWMWDVASSQCPGGTFASGKVHFGWDGSAVAALSATLFMLLMGAIARFPPFRASDRQRFGCFWGVIGTSFTIFLLFAIGGGLWFTSSTPVCLANSGIYHRTAPWRAFQRHPWTDVTKLDVDCRNRGKSPDLYYVVAMKDGSSLDVGDTLNYRAFAKFREKLVNVPFKFSANIHRSCPDWYSDWVGQKP